MRQTWKTFGFVVTLGAALCSRAADWHAQELYEKAQVQREELGDNPYVSEETWSHTREVVNRGTSKFVNALGCGARGRKDLFQAAINEAVNDIHTLGKSAKVASGRLTYESYLRAVGWDYLERATKACGKSCYQRLQAPLSQFLFVLQNHDLRQPETQKLAISIVTTLYRQVESLAASGRRMPCEALDGSTAAAGGKSEASASVARQDSVAPSHGASDPAPGSHAPASTSSGSEGSGSASSAPAVTPTPSRTASGSGRRRPDCTPRDLKIVDKRGRCFEIPAAGKVGKFPVESHLVTKSELSRNGRWPSSKSDGLQSHLDSSCALLKERFAGVNCALVYPTKWHKVWTPAEGGGARGQGKHAQPPDLMNEMFSFNMRWNPAVPPGTKFLLTLGDRQVVVVGGYEYGPNAGLFDSGYIGGIQPEVQYFLGAQRQSKIKVQMLADQSMPLGPTNCR